MQAGNGRLTRKTMYVQNKVDEPDRKNVISPWMSFVLFCFGGLYLRSTSSNISRLCSKNCKREFVGQRRIRNVQKLKKKHQITHENQPRNHFCSIMLDLGARSFSRICMLGSGYIKRFLGGNLVR